MKYLLDTSVCIPLVNGKDLSLREKIIASTKEELVICSIVKAELYYGAQKSQNRLRNEQRLAVFFSQIGSLAFDDESSVQYGALRASLDQTGEPTGEVIGANDLMIAAVALQYRLILVTRNQREFARIPSLKVEVW